MGTSAAERRLRHSSGFTLIELLIVIAVIGIIAAIANPSLLRARMSGNEASAIGSVRTIHSAQPVFSSSCGGGGFAVDLVDLGRAPLGGGAGPFIAADLAGAFPGGAPKSGYEFTLAADGGDVVMAAADTCNGSMSDTETEFFMTADPVASTTGSRFFGADHTGQIRQDSMAIAAITDGIPLQ